MNSLDTHTLLGQLNETQRQLKTVEELQSAMAERRRILARDGRATTVVAGVVGISGLFFMRELPFYLILGLLVVGIPLVWRHLVKEAAEFTLTDTEIEAVLNENKKK